MAIIRKLSKTQYVKGLQCPKALWYYINRKDLKPDIDIVTQARFDTGKEIGFLAQKYFSGGKEVTEDYWEIGKAAQTTEEFVKEGYKVIYEAVAINQMDGSYSRIDIFHNNAETNDWDLIEVKSSTKVKDYHLEDISFQYHVFSNAGYKIGKCLLMFINNEYLRQGDIDPKGLFKFEDVTEDVIANQNKIEPILAQLSYVLEQKEEPEEDIGSRCYSPYECDYIHHCWKQVPDYSIYNVYTKKRADEIYSEIISYNVLDIPTDLFPTSIKSIDIDCFQNDK